jgi:hypothetical protein
MDHDRRNANTPATRCATGITPGGRASVPASTVVAGGRQPLPDMGDQERIRELERRNRELEMENALLKRQPCNYALNGSWQIV